MADGVEKAVAKVLAAAAHLPSIERSTSYGSPSIKVKGKYLCSIKDANTLSLRCAMEDKEMLFEAAPDIYYETDHYKGWPGLLVRINKISKKELSVRLERAWRIQAPKALLKSFDGQETATSEKKHDPVKRRKTLRSAARAKERLR